MIVAHFLQDFETLKAFSLTCRSWYVVVAPHIHRAFVLGRRKDLYRARGGLVRLSELHELNLIPFTRDLQVRRWGWPGGWFGPQAFTPNGLLHFSAFTNVQVLKIQGMDIGRFFPGIERYFHQFSPTLRSLSLEDPACRSPQQLSYFLSLFPNLDDIDIRGSYPSEAPIPDTQPVPFSAPSLQGRLTLHSFTMFQTWAHLIELCGGLRFRYMALYNVGECTPTLLDACSETLETLRFYESDRIDNPSLTLNLSRLKALRSLEVVNLTGRIWEPITHCNVIKRVFPTIKSPVFSEFVIVFLWNQRNDLLLASALFETLRTLHRVRPFKLVFLFQGWYSPSRDEHGVFEEMIESMTAKGFLGFLDSPPTIRGEPL
ncbi:hypothetical protein BJ322DRAFT_1043441 [Thelephora terrestris]|uniref:Uncharacterized protein n=1 Tax=Thelephora terrestris TaxID=56493 RepID=A0A9P6HKX0_9AGAM|nr:hypothetical protein BJ322DRAFT_1043441 [Thelephora terrestris]